MGLKSLLTIMIMSILLTSCNCARRGKSTTSSVQVQTIDGDTYNCIDFYKQPGFDHPLLRNHSYHPQMKSSYDLKRIKDEKSYQPIQLSDIWRNRKGCPDGTIPIRSEFYGARSNDPTNYESGYHFAGIRTKGNSNEKYNGAGMTTTVYNPKVNALQSSGVRVKVQGGSDYIEAGWMVNPNLNRDNRTRLFVFTHTNNLHCFNMLCPGYIHLNRAYAIDAALSPVSIPGGKTYGFNFYIHKDPWKGDWWLLAGEQKVQIGFWPEKIFSGLKELSTYIEWGGRVYSPLGIPSPQMGAGNKLQHNHYYDAYCQFVVTVNEEHKIVDASNTEEYVDINTVYQVSDLGIYKDHGHFFYFGGVGGYEGK